MPLTDAQAYLTTEGAWCDDCVPIEGTEPADVTRAICSGCAAHLGSGWLREELLRTEAEARADMLTHCNWCAGPLTDARVCVTCSLELCAAHTETCMSCRQTVCPDDMRRCTCVDDIRCRACHTMHIAVCLRIRARPVRNPAFAFINDSTDESLIVTKHVRPKTTTRKRLRRPAPGAAG